MNQRFTNLTMGLALIGAVATGSSVHAQSVGAALLSEKTVTITSGATTQPLAVGGDVQFGARIDTGFDAGNVDEFRDGTRLTVAAESSVTVDKYVFDPATGSGEMSVRLAKGALRFISGQIGSDNYEIRTPNAFLGIRGTSFVLSYTPAGGTVVVVEEGVVELTNLSGDGVDVAAGLASSVAATNAAPTAPAPPAAAANAAVANVNTSVAISAPATVGAVTTATQLATKATAAAAAAASTPADNSDSSFGGDGKY